MKKVFLLNKKLLNKNLFLIITKGIMVLMTHFDTMYLNILNG